MSFSHLNVVRGSSRYPVTGKSEDLTLCITLRKFIIKNIFVLFKFKLTFRLVDVLHVI